MDESNDLPLGEERNALRDNVEESLGVKRPPPVAPRYVAPRPDALPARPSEWPSAWPRERSTPATSGKPVWNDAAYLTLAGVTFDKRDVMRIINRDLPALLVELSQDKTVRARFLNIVLAPLVREYNEAVMQRPVAPASTKITEGL